MYTFLYLVKQAILPPSLILFLLIVGFLFTLTRWRRGGLVLLGLAILLYLGLSMGATAHLIVRPLESYYPTLRRETVPRQGTLVVLGGGVWSRTDLPAASRLSRAASTRLVEAARLYRLMEEAEIVVSGGKASPFVPVAEAPVMGDFLVSIGIPAGKIMVETEARTTYENVERLRKFSLRRPLILVTSAQHMPRAMRVFTALGEEPLPAPCDFRGLWNSDDPGFYLPSAEVFAASTSAIYEYLGIVWYQVSGRFSRRSA